MADSKDWRLPVELQPDPRQLAYDLAVAMRAMVLLRAEVAEDAFTAGVLGTERIGHGALIRAPGREVVLTIGYLITEAHSIWLTSHSGRVVQGHALAYDYATGFGLVQPLGTLDGTPLALATGAPPEVGEDLVVIGHGGAEHALATQLIGRHEFAGYWEYLLEEGLYTAPAYPMWSGSALLDPQGRLLGIGSLLTQVRPEGESAGVQANLYVPTNLLAPLLDDLMELGQSRAPLRPWLGVYAEAQAGVVRVSGLVAGGPAHAAGVSLGDAITAVGAIPVHSLGEFYRMLWRQGSAGVTVRLALERAGEALEVGVVSSNRAAHLKQPQRH